MAEPKIVLACVDFSTASDTVLAEAVEYAQLTDGALHVATVGNAVGDKIRLDLGDKVGEFAEKAATSLVRVRIERDLERLAGKPPGDELRVHVVTGPAASALIDLAAEIDADVVIVGTHSRRGAQRLLVGSVAEAVVRGVGCPVLVARPKEHAGAAQRGDPEA